MLFNQDILKLVFGIKVRSLRLDKGLSLKDLSQQTGLSPSYINEIEKGKKYPKLEKIGLLAKALHEKIEDLTSLELGRDLQIIQNLLDKKFLTGVPFDLFGIPASTVFELLSERPHKIKSLATTFLEIARAHNIKIEDLFSALLRSYIDMHENYFPHLEAAAQDVTQKFGIDWTLPSSELKNQLITCLKNYDISVVEMDLLKICPDLTEIVYFITKNNQFFISEKLDLKQQNYILAREIGYQHLKLKERSRTSLLVKIDSFTVLLNHYQASYFAVSLLAPEKEFVADIKNLFAQSNWDEKIFHHIMTKYACPVDNCFHRISQLLPKHFGIKQLFFLHNTYDRTTQRNEIVRELHLSKPHAPHRILGSYEHPCSLWLVHRLTKSHLQSEHTELGIQRSFSSSMENLYLVMGMSLQNETTPNRLDSYSIGVDMTEQVKAKIPWATSTSIPDFNIGETCERCLKTCPVRQAPLQPQYDQEKYDRIFKALENLNH